MSNVNTSQTAAIAELTSQIMVANYTALEALRREIVAYRLQNADHDVREMLPATSREFHGAGVRLLAGYDQHVSYATLKDLIAHFSQGISWRGANPDSL